jgi:imidazole glycerol-phosphate synthase subunit HisH
MNPKVTVIDYGAGNLFSVTRALEVSGADIELAASPDRILAASRLILPGVGAFADGMAGLRARNLVDPIRHYARLERPFLGICLGMQMMLDSTEEFGIHEGLGLIPGTVKPVPVMAADGSPHKVPHVCWNELRHPHEGDRWDGTIFDGLAPGASMYFVHSFMAMPDDSAHYLAVCDYNGRRITAAIRKGAIGGCQFHPEKSARNGLQVFRNFLNQ